MSARGTIRVVIVDDEEPARLLIREYLAAEPDVEIAAECANGFEAVKRVNELNPELVFLDVQMPKLSGFEVLELLDPGPLVIFCTAYDQYALKAFEVHAVDYLLKPFSGERLQDALERARARLKSESAGGSAIAPASAGGAGADREAAGTSAPMTAPAAALAGAESASRLTAAARGPRFVERIVVREGSRVHIIPIEQLDYIEAQDDYVAIHAGGRSWLKSQRLADLAAGLDPARFVRIHRSHILNIERLARIEPYGKDSHVAILAGGAELPVSRSGYARLRELL